MENIVSIEVKSDFGKTITKGDYQLFNAGYGIGHTYYDIKAEVGSDLWRKCLWHQVNFFVEGLTEAEFMLPMYRWLHKLIPTNLGSNRRDTHSAFWWDRSFSIKKIGEEIHINGGESAYSLCGKKLKSPMEKEIEAAIPTAPKGHPFIEGQSDEYGTTVTLGGIDTTLSGENVVILNSPDLDGIAAKYSGSSDSGWSKKFIHIAHVEDLAKPAYVQIDNFCLNNKIDMGSGFEWYFPGKKAFIPMGLKKSHELMIKFGMEVPEWLTEKFSNHIPREGVGWKLIN